ncbi:MAG: M4 family metallopeptidase [Holophagaceae bacterium]|nr:M4 family metallopeptidase [Holophagaceae bacterium]
MATLKGRISLSLIASLLAAGSAFAADRAQIARQHSDAATARLQSQRTEMGLDGSSDFRMRALHVDDLNQTHTRFQQTYNGVKVWGGEVIMHTTEEGQLLPMTADHKVNIRLNTTASLTDSEVLAIVRNEVAPKGDFSIAPSAELIVYPETVDMRRPGNRFATSDEEANAMDFSRQVTRYTLAYHVHIELENELDGIRHSDFIINAHTGAILASWNDLHTAGVTGTGKSQYNGTISINTNSVTSGFEMRDMTRGTGGTFGNNVVTNSNHATTTSTATGSIYTDADNTWGDGANYVEGSSTTAANGQTAAVDAMFGMMKSWDFFLNVMGRNGINGAGKATYSRVHVSNSYDNAFWSDSCFCMTYGDGSSFTTLTALDVAGHEMSHGVCANSANLTYSGESGGLNESNSDIFGTMIEFYARGGSGSTIGSTGGNWKIGEQLNASPLRYMDKPSLDGSSPNAWSSSLGSMDVHYSSGPNNRFFYFLSQGAGTVSSANNYSSYLPGGMTGIGNDKAARIWYRTLTTKLTSSSNYAAARTGAIAAAKELYGAGTAEEQAVWNAYAAINVGAKWGGTTPPPPTGNAEVEPNNSSTAAQSIATSGTTISGTMASSTDQDWYKCTLGAGRTMVTTLTPNASSDYDLYVYNSNVTQIGSATNGTGAVDSVSVTNTGTSAFVRYAKVIFYSGSTGTAGTYTLKMTF